MDTAENRQRTMAKQMQKPFSHNRYIPRHHHPLLQSHPPFISGCRLISQSTSELRHRARSLSVSLIELTYGYFLVFMLPFVIFNKFHFRAEAQWKGDNSKYTRLVECYAINDSLFRVASILLCHTKIWSFYQMFSIQCALYCCHCVWCTLHRPRDTRF